MLVASLALGLVAIEVLSFAFFKAPGLWRGRLPEGVERQALRYHQTFLRGAPIQARLECTEHDPELLYQLRPGSCRFDTDEFETVVSVSRRHLREDRESDEPDFVVLGDSYSLGWGVSREEAYPAILAKDLNAVEVVAANSSYGTPRELLLLRRLHLRDFRAVVLQYCTNDLEENQAFVEARGYRPSPPSVFFDAVRIMSRIDGKRFLKYSRHWFSMLWSDFRSPRQKGRGAVTPTEQARLLLDILGAFSEELRGKPILIFAADFGRDDAAFVRALNTLDKPKGLGTVVGLDATGGLTRSDAFVMDQHWRASGHREIARALERELKVAVYRPSSASRTALSFSRQPLRTLTNN